MKKYNIGISVVLVILAGFMIRSALKMSGAVNGTAMGSGVWPILLGALLILLCAILVLQTFMQKQSTEEADPFDFKSDGMKRIYVLAGILLAFAVLLKLFGFYISIALFVPAVLVLLGERRVPMILGLTAGILVFIHIVFVMLLGLQMPVGILFK